jgi:hypothetical protein
MVRMWRRASDEAIPTRGVESSLVDDQRTREYRTRYDSRQQERKVRYNGNEYRQEVRGARGREDRPGVRVLRSTLLTRRDLEGHRRRAESERRMHR